MWLLEIFTAFFITSTVQCYIYLHDTFAAKYDLIVLLLILSSQFR